jgi:hypothetical protein
LRASLLEPPPSRLSVGRGTAIFLHGRCEDPDGRIRTLLVEAEEVGEATRARRADEDWWATLPIAATASPVAVNLRLRAGLSSGGEETTELGVVELDPGLPGPRVRPTHSPWPGDDENRIAICMGTHNPPPELFERQISSIRDQTHDQWVCVISDDGSRPNSLEAIGEILGEDHRFVLVPAGHRLGFYGNYERALLLAPPDATHIALSDQDDRWHPDKLETLLASLGEGDMLAYSDMRIVMPDGELLSETYWRHRRNNWTDLATLLIGNTITGAASLFRRSLLDYALPFPPRVADAYHDHWLALVALACGPVRYVDRPLHDYVQHPDAVIGFASANADRAVGGRLAGLPARTRRLAGRVVRPESRRRYFEDYCRIAHAATVLELRCGEVMSDSKRAAVARVRDLDDSLRATAGLALRSLAPGNETMGVDRSVLAGLGWSRLARRKR